MPFFSPFEYSLAALPDIHDVILSISLSKFSLLYLILELFSILLLLLSSSFNDWFVIDLSPFLYVY